MRFFSSTAAFSLIASLILSTLAPTASVAISPYSPAACFSEQALNPFSEWIHPYGPRQAGRVHRRVAGGVGDYSAEASKLLGAIVDALPYGARLPRLSGPQLQALLNTRGNLHASQVNTIVPGLSTAEAERLAVTVWDYFWSWMWTLGDAKITAGVPRTIRLRLSDGRRALFYCHDHTHEYGHDSYHFAGRLPEGMVEFKFTLQSDALYWDSVEVPATAPRGVGTAVGRWILELAEHRYPKARFPLVFNMMQNALMLRVARRLFQEKTMEWSSGPETRWQRLSESDLYGEAAPLITYDPAARIRVLKMGHLYQAIDPPSSLSVHFDGPYVTVLRRDTGEPLERVNLAESRIVLRGVPRRYFWREAVARIVRDTLPSSLPPSLHEAVARAARAGLTFVLGSPFDETAIQTLHRAAFGGLRELPVRSSLEASESPALNEIFLLAKRDGRILGQLALTEEMDDRVLLSGLAVEVFHRGHQLATALIAQALRIAPVLWPHARVLYFFAKSNSASARIAETLKASSQSSSHYGKGYYGYTFLLRQPA